MGVLPKGHSLFISVKILTSKKSKEPEIGKGSSNLRLLDKTRPKDDIILHINFPYFFYDCVGGKK